MISVKRIALVILLLSVSCSLAQYTSPLTDQAGLTEALWDMETITGGKILDQDGSNPWRNHELVVSGAVTGASGHSGFGNSLVFDGVNDYAVSSIPWHKDRVGVVVEAWVWINPSQSSDPAYLISSPNAWRIFLSGNGTQVNFIVWDARTTATVDSFTTVTAPITKGSWQHIRAEFYENASGQGALNLSILGGANNTVTAPSNKMWSDDFPVYLGAKAPGSTSFFKGELDDVRITSQGGSSTAVRGNRMVECYFLDFDPSSTNGGDVATWCLATLWMGVWHNVTAGDIATANAKLVDLSNPAKFTQIPMTPPQLDESDDPETYWGLLNLARIVNDAYAYGNLTGAAESSIRTILTNFVTERDTAVSDAENTEGALWTQYKSMNHDWLRKVTFLLTAQYYKNHSLSLNYADGLTATQHYDRWVAHLKAKLRQQAARGIDPEIGSPGYVSISLNALFALREYCDDADLSLLAEKFINLYLADAAAESFHGVRGGSKTRSYSGGASFNADADYYGQWAHLLSGDPAALPEGAVTRHAVGAAMSSYTAPSVLGNLMGNVTGKNFDHTSRRPAKGVHENPDYNNRNPVYHFKFPSDIRRNTYGTPKFILGSFGILDNQPRYTPPNDWNTYYSLLTQVDQWMGLITSGWRYSRMYFQAGPGDNVSTFNTLTAVQGGSTNPSVPGSSAMLVKRVKYPGSTYDIFCWMSDDFRANKVGPDSGTNYWIFSQNYTGDTYVAMKAAGATSSGNYTVANITDPAGLGTDARIDFPNDNDIIAFDVAPASAYGGNFTAFQSDVKNNAYTKAANYAQYVSVGNRTLRLYTDGTNSMIDGAAYPGNINKTYSGEYLSNSVYDSPVITVKDPSNNTLSLDFTYTGYAIDPDWVELKNDVFESGMGNYTDDGTFCGIDSVTANAHQGSYTLGVSKSVNIESSGSSASFTLTSGLNLHTPGYTQLKIEFWYKASSMEAGENFKLEFSNNGGGSWTTAATYTSGTQFQNGQFRYGCVVLNESAYGAFASNAKIRFKCYGSATDDDVFIDQVKISARVK